MKIASPLAAGLCLSLLAACSSTPAARTPKTTAPVRPAPYVVAERYVSKPVADEELDSLATWYNKADKRTWLIASGKSTHRLSVFDAADGSLLRHVGGKGKRAGQFTRPNGLAVSGDLLFVVERDSPRVQVLRLPGFTRPARSAAISCAAPTASGCMPATRKPCTCMSPTASCRARRRTWCHR